MTEPDLERLVKDWYQRHSSEDKDAPAAASVDCLTLTRLWQHVAEGQPLGDARQHVERCDRCRGLCEIIKREHGRTPAVASLGGRSLKPVYAIGGVLAAAACIAFLIVGLPQPSFEADVIAFAEPAYSSVDPLAMRGDEQQGLDASKEAEPDWLVRALGDPMVRDALADQDLVGSRIVLALADERLQIDAEGRLTLAAEVDEATAEGRKLNDLIKRDRDATERIVDALLRHLPRAKEENRPALRGLLTRYRAANVFGRSN